MTLLAHPAAREPPVRSMDLPEGAEEPVTTQGTEAVERTDAAYPSPPPSPALNKPVITSQTSVTQLRAKYWSSFVVLNQHLPHLLGSVLCR